MKPNFAAATAAADEILTQYNFTRPPIDPEKIAEAEGLRVVYADFDGESASSVSGFFRLRDMTIVVNKAIHPNRITFTIAHELGHYKLHQAYIKSNDYQPMPRNNVYRGRKPKEETEADFFAASLLVPLHLLRKYASVADVFELARLFFVSEEVIRNRLDLLVRHPALART